MNKSRKPLCSQDLFHSAVHNNAEWCELVASAHNIASERLENAWKTTESMPPFYPNVVSTKAGTNAEEVSQLAGGLPRKCAWKDSYADLDLTDHGFSIIFDAHWYARSGNHPNLASPEAVEKVSSTKELEEWIAAWGDTLPNQPIFTPELLTQNVRFVLRRAAGQMDAGLILNWSANAVGISNTFGKPDGIVDCISYAVENANGLPLVGYGSSKELRELEPLGFKDLGKLRVWVR